ncbi:hypothetical protein BGX26_003726 [Mortierella sp. AD094]|nr:hypothetical protein BGX26_003726 [Mortierella sp. AD094]
MPKMPNNPRLSSPRPSIHRSEHNQRTDEGGDESKDEDEPNVKLEAKFKDIKRCIYNAAWCISTTNNKLDKCWLFMSVSTAELRRLIQHDDLNRYYIEDMADSNFTLDYEPRSAECSRPFQIHLLGFDLIMQMILNSTEYRWIPHPYHFPLDLDHDFYCVSGQGEQDAGGFSRARSESIVYLELLMTSVPHLLKRRPENCYGYIS